MIHLANGRVLDPANGRDAAGDVWIDGGRIVPPPESGGAGGTFDVSGCVVMAGGIDVHTHIAGGNIDTARLLMPEWHRAHARRGTTALARLGWSTDVTGKLYAAMGFTTAIEPAVVPEAALHAHLEMTDIPILDTGGLAVVGNTDRVLKLVAAGERQALRDHLAYVLDQTRTLGVKAINGGAAAAFKANAREFGFDDEVPGYGVTSRGIVTAIQAAAHELGVPHPVHVHCNRLGLAGNAETAIATMDALDGLPVHFAHLQFYGYGTEGRRGFSSAAARLAEEVNRRKTVTVDVGQVMFGETVTCSCDVSRQFSARGQARPRKWAIWEGEGNGGGIVPYTYDAENFHNAVQWAVGLELFLLIDDPWRVFFTTDHPNGAPFTAYPEILALLMSADLRAEWIARLPKAAMAVTTLPSIGREYTLSEIAIMTRAAPARLLGLKDRGHLGPGAVADVAVYRETADRAAMFGAAALVFESGEKVFESGRIVATPRGRGLGLGSRAEAQTARWTKEYYAETHGLDAALFGVPVEAIGRPVETVPWAN